MFHSVKSAKRNAISKAAKRDSLLFPAPGHDDTVGLGLHPPRSFPASLKCLVLSVLHHASLVCTCIMSL